MLKNLQCGTIAYLNDVLTEDNVAKLDLAINQTTTGPGQWFPINPARARTIQVVITGVAVVDIEYSNDGTNPVSGKVGITASSGWSDSDTWLWIRHNVTSITSGSVSTIVGAAS